MSRKPVDKQQPTECRQAIWEWVRLQKGVFNRTDVDVALDPTTIREYLFCLHKAGYLETISIGKRGESNTYKLVKDCGAEAPRLRKDGTPVTQGLGRQQLWNNMEILKQFSIQELIFNATIPIAESEARTYCAALCAAGYLVGRSNQRYQLLPGKWSGPRSPQIQRTKQVYDANLKKVVWSKIEGGAE